MSIRQRIEKIITDLTAALPDADKVDKGSAGAPGTRVRAAAQAAKGDLDGVRKAVLEAREE